ncbi:uncharacterized protein LOC131255316 [Magnolia sinica]|uniref:uncharacterized protein LOC131255316 n=1 Tax=Magnolia sinica TaxID=86752 RepID=UPI002657ECAF|nr:uncharacterized protein LOC131255316 [Magnolia sinica]
MGLALFSSSKNWTTGLENLVNAAPVDASIQARGIQLASHCICYDVRSTQSEIGHDIESIHHLFLSGGLANAAWEFVGRKFGISVQAASSARNAALFDDISPSIQKLTHRVSWWLQFVQNKSFSSLPVPTPMAAHSSSGQPSSRVFLSSATPPLQGVPSTRPSCEQAIILAVVKWLRPPPGWEKINIDGLALGNPGPSSGGGICRDENGAFLFAFHEGYGSGSNVHAEIRAIHDGLLLCFSKGLKNIIVESDS